MSSIARKLQKATNRAAKSASIRGEYLVAGLWTGPEGKRRMQKWLAEREQEEKARLFR